MDSFCFSSHSWQGGSLKMLLSFGSWFQASVQNRLVLPFLISKKLCCWINKKSCLTAFHISDPFSVGMNLISSFMGLWLEYLAFHMAAHDLLGTESHCHHIFAPMIALLWLGYHIPIPPFSFGLHAMVHFAKAHLCFVTVAPQRKLHYRFFIFLRTHLGTARIKKR